MFDELVDRDQVTDLHRSIYQIKLGKLLNIASYIHTGTNQHLQKIHPIHCARNDISCSRSSSVLRNIRHNYLPGRSVCSAIDNLISERSTMSAIGARVFGAAALKLWRDVTHPSTIQRFTFLF